MLLVLLSLYRHPGHDSIRPLHIKLPLGIQALADVILAQKECMQNKNNFLSFFITLASSVILFHFEAIRDTRAQVCPVVVCHSQESGTGKVSLLIMGCHNNIVFYREDQYFEYNIRYIWCQ